MKIRIFALAKELDMDSKVLIKHCNDAGVSVKSSALASISPEERDIVVNYLSNLSSAPAPEKSAPLAPVRERSADRREIKKMPSRPSRPSRPATESARKKAGAAAEAAAPEAEVESAPPEAEKTSEAEPSEVEEEVQAEAGPAKETAKEEVAPIRKRDYVPPDGGSGMSAIREMKPRGTTPETRQGSGGKSSRKQALPNVAAPPTYKPPVTPKPEEEETAQKPVVKLTADALKQQSPLQDHLRKHTEKRKGKSKRRDEERDRPGMSLIEMRKRRAEQEKQARGPGGGAGKGLQRRGPRPSRRRGPVELKTEAQIELPVTLRGLSEEIGRPVKDIQRFLFDRGQMVTINDFIDEDLAMEVGMELGVDITVKRPRTIEDELEESLSGPEPEEQLQERPPIITILGHVDHGKTSLLDKIRSASVASGEAGGITQHIASYQVAHNGHELTFVDTPGHAAFGEMRARGANVTDIIVLVVAADDGVMPQTVECISHAKAAEVPIVVAMNKIDLPDVNENKVLQDLSAHDILPAEWGGDVDVVRTSAETGQGIDDLLETLMVTAELHEYKANPERNAVGVCLEGFRDEGRGALAWLIVQKGTLRIGDVVLCGGAYGRIRAMYDDYDREMTEAGPSQPVKVAGLDSVPGAGEHFYVLDDIESAREAAEDRHHRGRTDMLRGKSPGPRTIDDILDAARQGKVQDLPLIIKADTPGSLEAIRSELEKFEHPEVRIKILHEGVGGVNESDVYLASASNAVIVAFHVIAEDRARALAETESVQIRRYSIIYELTDHIRNVLEGMLEPERVEVPTGRALVLRTFNISRFGTIAGCRVLQGSIDRNNRVHVIRDQTVLNDYDIASLKREKDDVKDVREGMECGIRLAGFNDVKEGDLLEAFRIDEIKRTLE